MPHMRLPRSNQSEVASYRCDGTTSLLGSMRLLGPTVPSHSCGLAKAAGCADPFLLVVGVAATASAAYVGRLLSTAHGRCTF